MSAPVVKTVRVACTAEQAFRVWTERASLWWPRGHRPSRDPDSRIFFEGHAHPVIDNVDYYQWLFECMGIESPQLLGHSEGELRPLFYLPLTRASGA